MVKASQKKNSEAFIVWLVTGLKTVLLFYVTRSRSFYLVNKKILVRVFHVKMSYEKIFNVKIV